MALYKIKKSNIDNKGLVAAKDIKKGTKIIEYKGKLISKKESEDNPKFDNSEKDLSFEINKRYDLDGDFNFNTARLINHSCNPNCEVVGKGLKLWIESIKDIKKGEESSPTTMVSVLMKILKIIHANVIQKLLWIYCKTSLKVEDQKIT